MTITASGGNDGTYTMIRDVGRTALGFNESEWEITRPVTFVVDQNGRPITHPDIVAATIFQLLDEISHYIRDAVFTPNDCHHAHHYDMAATGLRRRPDGSWLLVTRAWVYTMPNNWRDMELAVKERDVRGIEDLYPDEGKDLPAGPHTGERDCPCGCIRENRIAWVASLTEPQRLRLRADAIDAREGMAS